jgi:hypothetical protein
VQEAATATIAPAVAMDMPDAGMIYATQHVRRMRGGAQGHLMRASDGHFYVVKFRNNPQDRRVLANDLIANRLAERVGLPVPVARVIEVKQWLVEHSPDLNIQLAGRVIPCQSGLAFASRYVVDPFEGRVFDYLPQQMLSRIRNIEMFAGILAFDKWTCNSDGRQCVYSKKGREQKYTVTFIDHGYCFNAGEWTFPDSPLRGIYPYNTVYLGVTGWESFEPWLSQIEELSESAIWASGEGVPPEWYGEWDDIERLLTALIRRRAQVRELITSFRQSSRNPFPNWL